MAGVVDVKSYSIIEFSGPNKSKIETYYDISVIFFFSFLCDAGGG